MGISQPMLTKNIQDLENILGGVLFQRDRKNVLLNDAGRAYVQQARLALLYGERAMQAARGAMHGADVLFHVGRSPYTDPFLVSTLLAIQLPLFPRLKIELSSQYSVELVHELLAGTLDLAIATQPPESKLLTRVQIAESPFYIAMSTSDELACHFEVNFDLLANRRWILFERRLHPPLYDCLMQAAERQHVRPLSVQHITAPEEAFPFVSDNCAIAFVVKTGALRLARNGVTVRPFSEPELRLKTFLISRADDESKVASELVRAFVRKIADVRKEMQLSLAMT